VNEDFERVFSAIDRVPWSKIEHAYGPATDVPDLIRALTSQDEKVRNQAWSELHGNLWHQGTIYEATAHVVPVFLELLERPKALGKNEVLVFLALLFTGTSYWDVHQHLTIAQAEVGRPGFQEKLKAELGWVEATKSAVVKGREIYVGLLQKGDSGARIASAFLLGLIGASDFDTLEEIIKAGEM
jgi:hypothetical protein